MRKIIFVSLFGFGFWSCNEENEVGIKSLDIELEFVDSIVVESLSELNLAAVNETNGQMIFKDRFLNLLLLTSEKGDVLDTLEIKGEAPNQVSFPVEFAFFGADLIVKDLEAGMPLSIFNPDLKK